MLWELEASQEGQGHSQEGGCEASENWDPLSDLAGGHGVAASDGASELW